jgi:hypothetical protein
MPPRALCRDAFGVDTRTDAEWWRRPGPAVLDRIERWTGAGRDLLEKMTLNGWAATGDDEEAERFSAQRWHGGKAAATRARPISACPRCISEASPHLDLIWMLGWAGACPQHGCLLTDRCPSCDEGWRLRGLGDAGMVELLVCFDCGASLAQTGSLRARPAVIELQSTLIAAKRSGTADLPIGRLDWSTTMTLADVLLGMVWESAPSVQRDRLASRHREHLFSRITRDLRIGPRDQAALPWTTNYGGLAILTWLLGDLPTRLPYAMATLCKPSLDGLLERIDGRDHAIANRLRMVLAPAAHRLKPRRRV